MILEVIRDQARHHWSDGSVTSAQSFPATGNFDLPANAHGVLMVHNEDVVDTGAGFDTHRHENVEIVTWVLEGAVEHRDFNGNSGILTPGLVQRMSAGRGITHSERNASTRAEDVAAHVVQMWLPPDGDGRDPSYAEHDFTDELAGGQLIPVVSGRAGHRGTTALDIGNRFVALHAARPRARQGVTLPAAPFGHLFVARGAVELVGTGRLDTGDAVRTTDADEIALIATDDAEILFWEMHASFDL
ncbi:pirin family protein [uncultured Williamsia sp.]|uniref:pirin family protein n=1 Tax=uncultured Williamsia sp. TaxID=259311 RepID=UPI00262007B6|nr:pirin family protein [uncultured Williamsia sp.]